MTSSIISDDNYFNDEPLVIDYVLCFNKTENNKQRDSFLNSLRLYGFDLEFAMSDVIYNMAFVKIHLPKERIIEYANEHGFILKFQKKPKEYKERCLESPLFKKNSKFYKRLTTPPTDLTTYERHTVVNLILRNMPFGEGMKNTGIKILLEEEIFEAAFALHDGDYDWPRDGSVPNDLQLLYKYWADSFFIYSSQPLDLIEKYFGPQVGYYFGFLQYYTKMLTIASVLGILNFCIGIGLSIYGASQTVIKEGCESTKVLCPQCTKCDPDVIKDYCTFYYMYALFDNKFSLIFSICMAMWSCLFVIFWSYEENEFSIRWRISLSIFHEMSVRPEYYQHAHLSKNIESGDKYYIPTNHRIKNSLIGITFSIFLGSLIIVSVIGIFTFEMFLQNHLKRAELLSIVFVSILEVVKMIILRKIYSYFLKWLTELEMHQTQRDYEYAYKIKFFGFSFVNSYSVLIYLAFFKGKFYTHPADPDMQVPERTLLTSRCVPVGCSPYVTIMMMAVMIVKPLLISLNDVIFNEKKKPRPPNMTTWEKNYALKTSKFSSLCDEYETIVTEFGFVSMFSSAFPLSPLCALIMNVIRTNNEARRAVTANRRPVGKRTSGMRAWIDLLKFLSFVATLVNSLYMGFTSNFIQKYNYFLNNGNSMKGFMSYDLSEYSVNHTIWRLIPKDDCYYSGLRYPPRHVYKYEYDQLYYFLLVYRFTFVLMIEHTVLAIYAFVTYILPMFPLTLRKELEAEGKRHHFLEEDK